MNRALPETPEATETLRRLQHELRTPLGQIIGYSDLLVEEVSERGQEDLVDDLRRIRGAAVQLLSMVEETLSPAAEAAGAPPPPSSPPQTAPGAPPRVEGGRILVVDDDPANRDLLARRLSGRGHAVEAVAGGVEALRRIEDEIPDVVLLDVVMPDMDGLEVLDSIRRHHSLARLPVVMATGLSASEDVTAALARGANDYVTKPFDMPVVMARVETQLHLKRASGAVESLARQLELRNAFIRRTFGRYVSTEIASQLLESPDALDIRGERRRVSILTADLRGFSHLTETLAPTEVVILLNTYLSVMSEVIEEEGGVVDDFAGDGILALFGAPIARGDEEERAVTCAIRMQQALERVNARNAERGLPDVAMGIGIASGEVIVGNIGSDRRSEYTAIGSAVNLSARIESYSSGGEIWIAEETLREIQAVARVDRSREVHPKGFEKPLRIHRVVGLRGDRGLELPGESAELLPLPHEIPVHFSTLDGKRVRAEARSGALVALSGVGARVRAGGPVEELADLKLALLDDTGRPSDAGFYAKVVESDAQGFTLRITTRVGSASERLARALAEASAARTP
jgi:adenylate cyclase